MLLSLGGFQECPTLLTAVGLSNTCSACRIILISPPSEGLAFAIAHNPSRGSRMPIIREGTSCISSTRKSFLTPYEEIKSPQDMELMICTIARPQLSCNIYTTPIGTQRLLISVIVIYRRFMIHPGPPRNSAPPSLLRFPRDVRTTSVLRQLSVLIHVNKSS